MFSAVREATSGKDIWDQLQKIYQPQGLYREVALLEELTKIRYSDCPDMETYINRKMDAAERLRAIDNEILAGLILMGLPGNSLVQSISSQSDEITL